MVLFLYLQPLLLSRHPCSLQTRQPDDGVVWGRKVAWYGQVPQAYMPHRPAAGPVRKSKDKKYQPADHMGVLLKIPSLDCVQVGSQLGFPLGVMTPVPP